MRKSRTFRREGHAGVPRDGTGALGLEAAGAEPRDRTGGDRYNALPRAHRRRQGRDDRPSRCCCAIAMRDLSADEPAGACLVLIRGGKTKPFLLIASTSSRQLCEPPRTLS